MARLLKTFEESIEIGEKSIPYKLIRTKRRSIQISIFPDQRIEVRAPNFASDMEIQKMIRRKSDWILKKLTEFKKYTPRKSPLKYVSGEKHAYLGKNYTLQVTASRKNEIIPSGDFLILHCRDTGNSYIENLLQKWYLKRAAEIFPERIEAGLDRMKKYNLQMPTLKIRKMKTRWGSCSSKKNITLNLELVKFAQDLIDYVVVHELAHLVEHNHSKRFYAVLNQVMPDWKIRQKELNGGRFLCE